jgi:hypothetical protein
MVKGKVMALNFMKGIVKVVLTKDTGKKTKNKYNKRSLERW